MHHPLGTLLIGVAMLATTATASAQRPQTRAGLWGNFGIGQGSYGCEGCDGRRGGDAATFAIGGTLSSKVLLGVGINAWAKKINGVDVTVGTVTALARFYPSATGGFFLVGGLGYGSEDVKSGGLSYSESGAGAVLGMGLDLRVGRNLSVTPYWNGNVVSLDSGKSNFGQIGISLTVH
jgi:hypothetical protein